MIRIVEEDKILGTSKVTIKEKPIHVEEKAEDCFEQGIKVEQSGVVFKKEPEAEETHAEIEEQSEEEILEACMEDTSLAEEPEIQTASEEKKDETASQEAFKNQIYEDYMVSLNEQIDFLKNQLNEKNKQLNSKDELIRNFQFLLKEDRSRIQLLEHKLNTKKKSFWEKLFKPKPASVNE